MNNITTWFIGTHYPLTLNSLMYDYGRHDKNIAITTKNNIILLGRALRIGDE